MKKIFVFLAEGFEEIEAITTIDLLRRAGAEVTTVAVNASATVKGTHGIPVVADKLIGDILTTSADAYVLPGGLPGVTNLAADKSLKTLLKSAYQEDKWLAAICAAPSILGGLGILSGKAATCYPSFEPTLEGATPLDEAVVVSGRVITGRSAGVTIDFALAIIKELIGQEAADSVAQTIIVKS